MDAAMDTTCSCGETKAHRIATRRTADGFVVVLWSDGSLTWALGASIRGAWCNPRPSQRDRALRAGWLVIGEVEIHDGNDVPDLARAARWVTERAIDAHAAAHALTDDVAKAAVLEAAHGLPGALRQRLALMRRPVLRPTWVVLSADRDGRPTERVWVLHRMGVWAGYAVWDLVNHGREGRYRLMRRLPPTRGFDGSIKSEDTYEPTGIAFTTLAAMNAWLIENPPTLVG